MEKLAIVMTYPNGEEHYITSGNHFVKGNPPVAPYYGHNAARDQMNSFYSNPANAHLEFRIVAFPANTYASTPER